MEIKIKIKDWEDLTISDCIKLCSYKVPAKLKELYSKDKLEKYNELYNSFTEKDHIWFAKYYGKVLKIMLTDPSDVDYLQWHERVSIYELYCQDYIVSLYSEFPNYKPKRIKHFEFKGEKYYLPKTLKLLDNEIPMYKEKALTFVEGASLYSAIIDLQEKGIDKFPYFIATYCRKIDEKYNEDNVLLRAGYFHKLPMSIAWEVFFCIQNLLDISMRNTATYLEREVQMESLKKVG